MSSIDSSMTVGVFRDEAQAQQALTSLQNAGFDQVQFLRPGRAAPQSGGLFSGIKRLFTGDNEGIASNLMDTGVSEVDARYYQQEYEAGRIILTVRANERKQEALDILRRYGAYDAYTRNIQTATTSTSSTSDVTPVSEPTSTSDVTPLSEVTSTSERTPLSEPTSTSNVTPVSEPISLSEPAPAFESRSTSGVDSLAEEGADIANDTHLTPPTEEMTGTYDRQSIKLKEEQLNVSKQSVKTGEVELHKEVVTEQKTIDVPVTHEEIVVEHHAVSSNTNDTTPVGQDEEIRIPVTEERVTVTRTPVVTGEVSIEKRSVQETQHVTDTVKREELRVEQEGDAPIHGTSSDRFHGSKQRQNQTGKPRAKSRKKR